MKTDIILVSNKGYGIEDALEQIDKIAEQLEVSEREALHLHLLGEEMMNMVHSIIGGLEGKFWAEVSGKECIFHLKTITLLDREQQKQLISAATNGKNEAHRGIMGKMHAFFEPMPIDDTPEYLLDTIVADSNGDLTWSLEAYKERLRKNKDIAEGAKVEWDELEKSLVTHLADNIKVSIKGHDLDLVINKKINN
ncbi:hypothetical protein [Butyrivibrio sp. AE3004]|uniref:hypothetical protein n=1 Tax=Butyrivibrio sp. AE3004 TaxID=1506994 RepID=UPI000493D4A0|nr:hypothetical protein [Butyrivibrio sp. AE3004]